MRTNGTKRKNQSLIGNENTHCPELYVIISRHTRTEKNIGQLKYSNMKIQREESKVWLVMKTWLSGFTQHKLDTPKRNMDSTNNNCMHYPSVLNCIYILRDICTLKHHINVVIQASVLFILSCRSRYFIYKMY